VTRRWFGPLLLAKVVRNAKFQADPLALQYQRASKYHPGQFVRLLQNTSEQDRQSGFLTCLLYEHPRAKTRITRQQKSSATLKLRLNTLWTKTSFTKTRKGWRRRWLSTRSRNSGGTDERHERVP